jgi:hypothetical protein
MSNTEPTVVVPAAQFKAMQTLILASLERDRAEQAFRLAVLCNPKPPQDLVKARASTRLDYVFAMKAATGILPPT